MLEFNSEKERDSFLSKISKIKNIDKIADYSGETYDGVAVIDITLRKTSKTNTPTLELFYNKYGRSGKEAKISFSSGSPKTVKEIRDFGIEVEAAADLLELIQTGIKQNLFECKQLKTREIVSSDNTFIDFLGVNEKDLEADNDAKKAKYQYVNDSDYEYVLDSEGNSCREDIDNLKEEDTEDVYALKVAETDKEKYIEALEADEIRFEDNDESEDDKALIRFENKRAWKQGIAI